MIVSYSEGRIRLRIPQLKNPIVASGVKKRLAEIDGITDVEIKLLTGSLLIGFDPEVLPAKELFELGRKELDKHGIELKLPEV